MINLRDLLFEVTGENVMWTYKEAKPIADKIGGRIVGSVKTKGYSNHDLDIFVDKYTPEIENILKSFGFERLGSQVVSPEEIRKSRKFGKQVGVWLRNFGFENNGRHGTSEFKRIEIWIVETK